MSSTLAAQPPKIARSSWVSSFRKDRLRSALVILWLIVAGSALLSGLDYYLADEAARADEPSHRLLSPDGRVGYSLGLAGTVLTILGVASYSIRRRTAWFGGIGTMRSWLYIHIFLCSLGPFLIVLHATFKFSGLASALTWSLLVVVSSGAFGRFVYGWIPKTVHGRFLTGEELEAEMERLTTELIAVAGCSPAQAAVWIGPPVAVSEPSLSRAAYIWLRYNLSRRSRRTRLSGELRALGIKSTRNTEAVRLVLAENRIQAQKALLVPFHELFCRWRRSHVRLVGALAVVVGVHMIIVAAAGKVWMF